MHMKIYLVHLQDAGKEAIEQVKEKLFKMLQVSAEVIYGPHGKPYIAGNPWYFNISHSGEYLILVQSRYEVGVDIQLKRSCDVEKLVKKCCTQEEKQWILEGGSKEDKLHRFYRIWCRKEAYGKYLGCGLTTEVFAKNTQNLLDTITFLEYDILEEYQICICCNKEEKSEEIIRLPEGL